MAENPLKYPRILLKLSGEAFCAEGAGGIDGGELERIARELAQVIDQGVQLAVVVGGGNFFRGQQLCRAGNIDRTTADYMGMLATVLNAAALQSALEQLNHPTRVLSAISMTEICEPFIRRRGIRHLEKGRTVILAGGTGNPFFTTDTCAALRASELDADVLLKATKVDGVYSTDPKKDPNAQFYPHLRYEKAINENLGIMDLAAVDLCRRNDIPIVVFNLNKAGNIARVARGESIGTRINND